MALFEALGELVGTAVLTASSACDIETPNDALRSGKELFVALVAGKESRSIQAIVDALAREIWVGSETRGLSEQSIEHHVSSLTALIADHAPSSALIHQATSKARTSASDPRGADQGVRRIAVDIFSRSRAAGAITAAGLKDDVTLFLIDRVYGHLLDDPKTMQAFADDLRVFLGGVATTGPRPAEDGDNKGRTALQSLGLSSAVVSRMLAAGGPAMLADLRERYGLAEKAMVRMLGLLQAQGTRPDDFVAKLENLSRWLGDVRAQLLKPANEDAKVRRLKLKAANSLADGDFEGATDALRNIRRELREGRRQIEERLQEEIASLATQMIEEARATGRLAEVAIARQEYLQAAELFSEAALSLPTADRDGALKFQAQRAEALFLAGTQSGNTEVLNEALAAFSQILRTVADGTSPRVLAAASLGVANALFLIGEREAGSTRLKDAVVAYRKSIASTRREDDPRAWATANLKLGRALALIGEREEAPNSLREAAQAYREALKELQSDKFPTDHATAQMGLGNVLLSLEEREGGAILLTEASHAYQAAIDALGRETDPAGWADAQMSLGLSLLGLGEQSGDVERLEGAVKAFRSALDVFDRSGAPQKWALVHMNLGNALAAIGDRDLTSTDRLGEAIAAYTSALEEFPRDGEPLKWAITQLNLGTALIRLGERRDKRRNWLAAAGALVPALEVFEAQGTQTHADITRQNLRRLNDSWDQLISAPAQAPLAAPRQAPPSLEAATESILARLPRVG